MTARHRTAGAVAVLAVLAQALGPTSPARAADPVTETFTFTGAEQSFVVPDGITSIHVVLVGGRGGGGDLSAAGGAGAHVEGDLAVTPGTTLYIVVGANGGFGASATGGPGGFNGGAGGGRGAGGGGGGGGASDVRTTPVGTFDSLSSRLVVAAGGGGGGGGVTGGDGGAAGANGGFTSSDAVGGGAGTAFSGGQGGFSVFTPSGSAGSQGLGGEGGTACSTTCPSLSVGGGGGGGGLYGGGGGGSASSTSAGGGGGGSSFTGTATNASVTLDNTGVPSIAITYGGATGGGTAAGTVDAVVTMATSAVCLELSTTSVDFGTRQFGEVGAAAAPFIDVTNCSGIDENVLVRGTDASGPDGSAWSLVSFGACETGVLGTDNYRMRLKYVAAPDVDVAVTTENTQLDALGPSDTVEHEAQIDTPCPGSTGAGETMTMQILFTAIEEAAP